MPGLRSRSSKLHLIDDTTLTSLPFPPPAASKRPKRASSTCSRFTNNAQSTIPERVSLLSFDVSKEALEESTFVESVHSNRPETSELHNIQSTQSNTHSTQSICTYIDEAHEDSLEDAQDPIVLVEDYVTEAQSQKTMFRKKSLANIKKRLREESSRTSLSPSVGSAEPIQIEFGTSQYAHFPAPVFEDLEAIFGKIPGTERLKYCTICDKPLYEISSVLSSSVFSSSGVSGSALGGSTLSKSGAKDTQKHNLSHHYQEFVCSDCVVTYEQMLSEVHEVEMKYTDVFAAQPVLSRFNTKGVQKVTQDVTRVTQDTPKFTQDVTKVTQDKPRVTKDLTKKSLHTHNSHSCAQTPKRRKFSNDLINRLHHLSAVSQPPPPPPVASSEWLSGWSEKLKWNLNSILTNAFPPSERAT